MLGRADRFVETDPRYQPLARRLLGRTWIAQTLADAIALAKATHARVDFVTLAGELRGRWRIDRWSPPRFARADLAARELRALKSQRVELETRIEQLRGLHREAQEQIEQEEEHAGILAEQHQAAVVPLITATRSRRPRNGTVNLADNGR